MPESDLISNKSEKWDKKGIRARINVSQQMTGEDIKYKITGDFNQNIIFKARIYRGYTEWLNLSNCLKAKYYF